MVGYESIRRWCRVALLTALLVAGRQSAAVEPCPGDCNDDGHVTIDELVTGVDIVLGSAATDRCALLDVNEDQRGAIDELITAVRNAIEGCGPGGAPTATPTRTPPEPTLTPTLRTEPPVPTSPDELLAWLQDGNYLGWPAESGRRPSTPAHGSEVRTFVNPTLFASLEARNATHPAGASAVKEIYRSGVRVGWAVSVKAQANSAGGLGWYWYETFGGAPIEGFGESVCTGCHVAGRDFILIPFPLH